MSELRTRNASDWLRILRACGCSAATSSPWARIFADVLKDDVFSRGEDDLADFLPTVLHESQMLTKTIENGNYSAARIIQLGNASPSGSRWRSLVPQAGALSYNPPRFFEAVYGGRMGNNLPGDGAKYIGRGLIMLTGKANYQWQGDRSGQDLVDTPDLAAQPEYALQFAVDWWEGKVSDSLLGDTAAIRRVVNGGTFGIDDLDRLTTVCREALA